MSNISQKLTYLNGTKTKLKNVINYAGANITNDTFRSYPEKLYDKFIDFVTNGTDSLYSSLPKVTGENTELTLNNTANGVLKLDLKGNTSQNGEPTPDTPIPVNVVSGDNTIKVEGKNLLHLPSGTKTHGGITGTITNDNILTYSGTANHGYANITGTTIGITLQAGTYIFSIDSPQNVRVCLQENGVNHIIQAGSTQTHLTIGEERKLNYRVFLSGMTNGTSYSGTIKMQLEKSSSKTEYEPYQGANYSVNLPNGMELCKIGDYQDYIYKDNGNWYKYNAIGKIIFDGSENWAKSTITNVDRYRVNNNLCLNNASSLCNYFIKSGTGNYDVGKWANNANVQIFFNFAPYGTTTLEDWKTWVSTHNLVLYQPLVTPTTTQITDTTLISQLEAIESAMSYENQTNISQTNEDLPFVFSASAIKNYESLEV